ncbi:hypothetical protein HYU14_06510 [Candidatus Woesearchaeota archaeon]|nr:hypothetical protein [Candidatus Woesearchaeota archaeon]
MEPIELIDKHTLTEAEAETVNEIAKAAHKKMQRSLKDALLIAVHVKKHLKSKAVKYGIKVKLLSGPKFFEVQDFDWDLPKAMHKVMVNAENLVRHRLHTDSKTPRK